MRPFLLSLAFCVAASAHAQTAPPPDPDLPSVFLDVPSVPGVGSRLKGLNLGFTLTSVHDSAVGWYTLVTPAVAYSFSPRYSLDISMPVFLYRLAESETSTQPAGPGQQPPPSTTRLFAHTWDPGDLVLAGHANFGGHHWNDTLTPSMTLPSGDSGDGLSTGRPTFDIDNHFEARIARSTFLLGLGGGDSSSLVNRLVTRDYTSLGALAHFQLGQRVALPLHITFQAVAYEQLPLGDNKTYTTLTRPGYPSNTVVSGHSASEDNGFTNSLQLPLTHHLTLQGFYNRSLRLHTDTLGMGLSWVLRGRETQHRQSSYYDQLLRK